MTKRLVKFKKPWSAYTSGDLAGFDADTAKRLIDGGICDDAGDVQDAAAKASGQKGSGKSAGKTDAKTDGKDEAK
jgi:hypothetical protein